jgi:hypothetical protein
MAELPHGWLGDSALPERLMHEGPYAVTWRGEQFRFERLEDRRDLVPVWAVSRRREFIGTMPCGEGETTKEFEVRSVRWLAALLE